MRKWIIFSLGLLIVEVTMAQQRKEQIQQRIMHYEKMLKQIDEEGRIYYNGADTATYAIRYLWSYQFDKVHRREYHENRLLLVTPKLTLDQTYQSIGERLWLKKHYKDQEMGNDTTLANHLTPSFYFYRPEEKRIQCTYRIATEEFLLKDTVIQNDWKLMKEEKEIGGYHCQKAVCTRGGRIWYAWFTRDLPYTAGPRYLVGLPGVVLEASDETGEISWKFQQIIRNDADLTLYVKYPDHFSSIPLNRFPQILRIFSVTDRSYIQQAGIIGGHTKMLPEVFLPSTGIDACQISNPIEH